jgi:adenylate kinase
MRLVLLGPPGSGKGTQAKALAERFGVAHVSPGDIFRREVRAGTDLGRQVESAMASGGLVQDELTIELMEKSLSSLEGSGGFVLDGFPRNLSQALALDQILEKLGARLDAVVNLEVTEEAITERARTRRVCSVCGAPYNLTSQPPTIEGRCDRCAGTLTVRKDDGEETVRERCRVYRNHSEPLVEYYATRGSLVTVDGCRQPEKVTEAIVLAVSKKDGRI